MPVRSPQALVQGYDASHFHEIYNQYKISSIRLIRSCQRSGACWLSVGKRQFSLILELNNCEFWSICGMIEKVVVWRDEMMPFTKYARRMMTFGLRNRCSCGRFTTATSSASSSTESPIVKATVLMYPRHLEASLSLRLQTATSTSLMPSPNTCGLLIAPMSDEVT